MKGVSLPVRKLVLARDEGRCQWPMCGAWLDEFYSLQHRRARGMGGSRRPDTNQPSNLVAVCGSATTGCHGLIEANPELASELGFRVSQGTTPANVLIHTITHGVVYLDDNGTASRERADMNTNTKEPER